MFPSYQHQHVIFRAGQVNSFLSNLSNNKLNMDRRRSLLCNQIELNCGHDKKHPQKQTATENFLTTNTKIVMPTTAEMEKLQKLEMLLEPCRYVLHNIACKREIV